MQKRMQSVSSFSRCSRFNRGINSNSCWSKKTPKYGTNPQNEEIPLVCGPQHSPVLFRADHKPTSINGSSGLGVLGQKSVVRDSSELNWCPESGQGRG